MALCRLKRFVALAVSIATSTLATLVLHHSNRIRLNDKQHVLFGSNGDGHNFHKQWSLTLNSPLSPYTPLTHLFFSDKSGIIDSSKAEYLRSGYGMQNFTAPDGTNMWIENGVVYRPRGNQTENDVFKGSSQFEAYIPFNETIFFEGNQAKILRYQYLKAKAAKNNMPAESWQKVILWYQNKWFSQAMPFLLDMSSCPNFPCLLTSNWHYINVSAAMIMNGQFLKSPPPSRREEQVFIFYNIEPPTHHRGALPRVSRSSEHDSGWPGMFNWTMSYRHDADIQTYYALVRKRLKPLQKNYTDIMQSKSKMAAWIVTNHKSNSNREAFVREMQKYIDVDIYGQGMPYRCPRSFDSLCNEMIGRKYKFYFGFENSFCDNYITEKLYKYLGLNLVVVARGVNEYATVVPPEIFINVNDYSSPKELAKRLIHLDTHDEEYLEILRQKDKYFAIYEDYPLQNSFLEHRYESVSFCQVCQRLWNLDKYAKSIPDINIWFNQTQCYPPPADVT